MVFKYYAIISNPGLAHGLGLGYGLGLGLENLNSFKDYKLCPYRPVCLSPRDRARARKTNEAEARTRNTNERNCCIRTVTKKKRLLIKVNAVNL